MTRPVVPAEGKVHGSYRGAGKQGWPQFPALLLPPLVPRAHQVRERLVLLPPLSVRPYGPGGWRCRRAHLTLGAA